MHSRPSLRSPASFSFLPSRVLLLVLALALALPAWSPAPLRAQDIPSPEEFFGFRMGADRKLAHWDDMLEYYDLINERSDRVLVRDMGPSTQGNRFLSIFVSSPENLARLDELKRMNAVLQDPRGHSETEIDNAMENGKVVFVQTYGLHSSEVAASQAIVEIIYDMVTRDDQVMRQILDNTVAIMVPCLNPDGEIMVTEWYNRWVGTEYEGASLPVLYHPYIGHDNNRDAFMTNTVESEYGAEILFREWVPQGYIDHHQMGSTTARMAIPPYAEPIRPEADPLVWWEMDWWGGFMGYRMDEAGHSGVIGGAIYSGWGHFGFHWITPFHNIAGMLTEGASTRLATPIYIQPDQLRGSRGFPEYEAQVTFPNPWPGGWWHNRDVVDLQKIASLSPLELASKHRETLLRNAFQKAHRQTERGREGEVKAYIIPADQHDPLTMKKLVNKLLGQGVTVHRAPSEFVHENRVYDAGTYVVSMAQPKRGLIRWALGRTFYPDNTFTRNRDGSPMRPYDLSTDNFAEFMGVAVETAEAPVEIRLTEVTDWIDPRGSVTPGSEGYVLDGRLNDAFHAMNLLYEVGAEMRRVDEDGRGVKTGDFVVTGGVSGSDAARIAQETGVDFMALNEDVTAISHPMTQQRVGMYRRYWGGNMDEGWTRLMLEDFAFPYTSLRDEEILRGELHERWDVIILPEDSKMMMMGPGEGGASGYYSRWDPSRVPPDYRSGFGQDGVEALEDFVENGGTLMTFSQAGELPMEEFGLPVRNIVEGVWGEEFWAPGSTLRMKVETDDPFAYGMPDDALGLFRGGGQVYETMAGPDSEEIHRIVTYPERDILQSGWLLGEEAIAEKAAVLSVPHGEGIVYLIGFRPQHRHQTHGTYKLVFNALVN